MSTERGLMSAGLKRTSEQALSFLTASQLSPTSPFPVLLTLSTQQPCPTSRSASSIPTRVSLPSLPHIVPSPAGLPTVSATLVLCTSPAPLIFYRSFAHSRFPLQRSVLIRVYDAYPVVLQHRRAEHRHSQCRRRHGPGCRRPRTASRRHVGVRCGQHLWCNR